MSLNVSVKRSLDEGEPSADEMHMHQKSSAAAGEGDVDYKHDQAKRPRVTPTAILTEDLQSMDDHERVATLKSDEPEQKDTLPMEDHEAVATVKRPAIDKCIRNEDPAQIDKFGFVELSAGVLPPQLIHAARQEADDKLVRMQNRRLCEPNGVVEISNALQMDLSDGLLGQITGCMKGCDKVQKAMEAVFGDHGPLILSASNYSGFVVETPKILVTLPGSHPQLPHADDHCSSCLICLLHLGDNQEPTRIATYEAKDYPTGIEVICDLCNREEQLPDADFRRGVHLTDEPWHCDCEAPHTPYNFEGTLLKAFGELLEEGAPDLCDAYAGKKEKIKAGDGLLCLPTLVHRGPGNPSCATGPRYKLFFTLRPTFRRTRADATSRPYSPDLQIHTSCLLFHQFSKVQSIFESKGCSLEGSFNAIELIAGRRQAQLMKRESGRSQGVVPGDGYATLLKENDDLRQEIAQLKTVMADHGVAEDGSATNQGLALVQPPSQLQQRLLAAALTNESPTNDTDGNPAVQTRPNRLAIADDAAELNKLHQYVRRDLLEVFVVPEANLKDGDADSLDEEKMSCKRSSSGKREKSTTATNARRPARSCRSSSQSAIPQPQLQPKTHRSSQYPGRVGLRCVHCKSSVGKSATKSAFYPSQLSKLYREVSAWQRIHFGACTSVPDAVRKRYDHYKQIDTSRGKVKYWEASARKIGLVNNPERDDGIVFSKASLNA